MCAKYTSRCKCPRSAEPGASGLPPRLHALRWHDLRHTAAALSLAVNPSLALIEERPGPENIATPVDLYGKRVPDVDAALADAVGTSIFEAETNVVPLRKEDA